VSVANALGITLASPPHFWQIDTSMPPEVPTFGEYPLEALGLYAPGAGHGLVALIGCFILLRVRWVAFPASGGCHFGAVFAVWTVRRLYALRVPAKTPWNRVRFTPGFGTKAASLEMNSSGGSRPRSKISRCG
jgi:hypothetical protein